MKKEADFAGGPMNGSVSTYLDHGILVLHQIAHITSSFSFSFPIVLMKGTTSMSSGMLLV